MSRVANMALFALTYWFFALVAFFPLAMGECVEPGRQGCAEARQHTAWRILVALACVFAILALMRFRSRRSQRAWQWIAAPAPFAVVIAIALLNRS